MWRDIAYRLLPLPRRFSHLGSWFVWQYSGAVYKPAHDAAAKYHRRRLRELDSSFKMQEDGQKLVEARASA